MWISMILLSGQRIGYFISELANGSIGFISRTLMTPAQHCGWGVLHQAIDQSR